MRYAPGVPTLGRESVKSGEKPLIETWGPTEKDREGRSKNGRKWCLGKGGGGGRWGGGEVVLGGGGGGGGGGG